MRAKAAVSLRFVLAAFLAYTAWAKLLADDLGNAAYVAGALGELTVAGLLAFESTALLGAVVGCGAFVGAAAVGLGLLLFEAGNPSCRCLGSVAISRANAVAVQGALIATLATLSLILFTDPPATGSPDHGG